MAEGVTEEGYKSYFAAARSWDEDRARKADAEKRLAWRVAAGGVFVAIAAVAFHVAMPVRTIEPYVVRVNQQTGSVDVVSVLRDPKSVTSDEAVRKYFLAEYVRAREAWNSGARDQLFKQAALLSSSDALKKFRAERDPHINPEAPSLVYGNAATVGVTLRNITFLSDRVAQVRYTKTVERDGGEAGRTDWVATINYQFADAPETEEARLYNPLGFVIVSYRADPEIVR